MNLKSLKLFLFFCLTIALCSGDNIIELGVSNVKKLGNNEYLIDIYAKNNIPIAGIQFDILGEPFTDQKNGKWDTNEPFRDVNSNSSWDEGEPFTDKLNNQWDFGEPYKDINKNKNFSEPKVKEISADEKEKFREINFSYPQWTPGEDENSVLENKPLSSRIKYLEIENNSKKSSINFNV